MNRETILSFQLCVETGWFTILFRGGKSAGNVPFDRRGKTNRNSNNDILYNYLFFILKYIKD